MPEWLSKALSDNSPDIVQYYYYHHPLHCYLFHCLCCHWSYFCCEYFDHYHLHHFYSHFQKTPPFSAMILRCHLKVYTSQMSKIPLISVFFQVSLRYLLTNPHVPFPWLIWRNSLEELNSPGHMPRLISSCILLIIPFPFHWRKEIIKCFLGAKTGDARV